MKQGYILKTYKNAIAATMAAALFGLTGCGGSSGGADIAKVEELYESDVDAALPKVLDAVVGTWTYTEVPADFWYRFQITPDGKVASQLAMPSMDSWGEADEAVLVPFTSKYSDTGERYYGLRAQGQAWALIVESDGEVRYSDVDVKNMLLKREDPWPFSK